MPVDEGENAQETEVGSMEVKPSQTTIPLIFISHDSRDAELAEAFSKLLRSVSAGILKSFRSSDKKGTEGIGFGDEWYKRLMDKLNSASDVVCLLTERSLERPWILYEAGVAKGRLDTPVFGIALGIPLSKVSTGPFYQFQNCDDSEDSLSKLVMQLARRAPLCEPDNEVVRAQVRIFKSKVDKIISSIAQPGEEAETPSDNAAAKLFEELKVMVRDLPSRFEDRLAHDMGFGLRPKLQRFDLEGTLNIVKNLPMSDPNTILFFAILIRDDAPWLYEIAMEAFRALTLGTKKAIEGIKESLKTLQMYPIHRGVFLGLDIKSSKEGLTLMRKAPQLLEQMVNMCLEAKKTR